MDTTPPSHDYRLTDEKNPAGPLFSDGQYTEALIAREATDPNGLAQTECSAPACNCASINH